MLLSVTAHAQKLTDLDFVSPFHEGMAAVKKGEKWGFIDAKGTKVIDFRDDIVVAKDKGYPIFSDGRCLIKKKKNEIDHYGYINTEGVIVIPPDFLNATPFNNEHAIVIKVYKETLGRNELLDKNVITYNYNEEIIGPNGEGVSHLRGPFNLLYTKEKLRKPLKIKSKLLSDDLVAVPQENGQWEVKSIHLN